MQARSLTVSGAPYSYTVGSGDELAVALPNPGTYDLSVHGPSGFFRHFAGSPGTALRVEVHGDHDEWPAAGSRSSTRAVGAIARRSSSA